ncbi:MAG: sulfatase [Anaerolineales bacterium]|nr:sulfatase [Anaerolineales bacterium]
MNSLRFKVLSILMLVSLIATSCGAESKAVVLPMENRPNILFILTDDLDSRLGTMDYMQNVQNLLVARGTSIADYFVTSPVCCPSRTTTLKGQYTHNHGVYHNDSPNGGFVKFNESKGENSTLPVWLQAAGYRTALIGKYLNNYPNSNEREYVPPGWSEWYSPARKNAYDGYDYVLNENGVLVAYSPHEVNYFTDVMSRKAVDFIQRADKDDTPFFLYLSTFAPHEPSTPAYRHLNLFPDLTVPQTPSFNEADVSDKAPDMSRNPLLTQAQIDNMDELYRNRIRSLQAVDEMVAELVKTLEETGQLENTYIIFTSDNGFHMGQHRLYAGKEFLFEEDISVPFIVRGPGIAEGESVSGYLSGNVDLASTFSAWAGVEPPAFVDGRSLTNILAGNPIPYENWRQVFLLEEYRAGDENFPVPTYSGLRTEQYLYVEYSMGFVELYDIQKDPYQLENIAPSADPALLKYYSDWLEALNKCSGSTCRELETEFQPDS